MSNSKEIKTKKPFFREELFLCGDLRDVLEEAELADSPILNIHLKNCTLEDKDFSDLCFESSIFEHCSFTKVDFHHASFENISFRFCNFPSIDFSDSWFQRCEFKDCQLKGVNFTNNKLHDISFESCNMRYANFTSSSFKVCELKKCDLSDAFFAECTLKSLYPDDTKFIRTEFFKTSLKDIDFASSQIEGIRISQEGKELAGAIVNVCQAADLARMLGIVIKED